MGTVHWPLRQHLMLTGALPKGLMASEGKVTLSWGYDHYAHGPQLLY